MSSGWRCGAVATTSVRESGSIVKYDVRGTFASGRFLEYAGSDVLPARGGRFWHWRVNIAPVVQGTFLVVVAGMRQSFGGSGVFAGVVFRILRYLRGVSDFGGWEGELRGRGYPACCVLESFPGFRVGGARIVKNDVS